MSEGAEGNACDHMLWRKMVLPCPHNANFLECDNDVSRTTVWRGMKVHATGMVRLSKRGGDR